MTGRATHRPERLTAVQVARRDTDRELQAGAIGHQVDPRTRFAAVDRTRSGQAAPFLARTEALSRIFRDQFTTPWTPSRSSTAWCSLRRRPRPTA
ncbi:hypothetical protein GCM10009660_06930 [Catellatospora bangladeshensis]